MQQSPLPVEVCERILDAGYRPYRLRANGHYPGPGAYDTWRQTALVCSAWLPRSRRNLLHEVELRSAAHVDRLLRTLLRDDDSAFGFSPGRGSSGREHEYERVRGRRGSARLADIVVRVTVDTQDAYVPFTRMPLPRLLRNCTAYDLSRVDWGAHYPSRLVDAFLSSLWGQRILELQIALERGAFGAVLHLVWSLPVLRELTLYSESHQALSVPAGPREPDTAVCGSLRTLSIAYGCVTAAYPTHAFGRSIQELELSVNSCGVSDSVLDIIRGSPRLRRLSLTLLLDSDSGDSQHEGVFREILSSVSSSSETGLQSITIGLAPTFYLPPSRDIPNPPAKMSDTNDNDHGNSDSTSDADADALPYPYLRYFRDRDALLTLAATCEHAVRGARFTALNELRFWLREHDVDGAHDDAWWRAHILRRARVPEQFHSAVKVQVAMETDERCQYLWLEGDLPKGPWDRQPKLCRPS